MSKNSDKKMAEKLLTKIKLKELNNMNCDKEFNEVCEILLRNSDTNPQDNEKMFCREFSIILPEDNSERISVLSLMIIREIVSYKAGDVVEEWQKRLFILMGMISDTILEMCGTEYCDIALPDDHLFERVGDEYENIKENVELYINDSMEYILILLQRIQKTDLTQPSNSVYAMGLRFGILSLQLDQITRFYM